MDRQLCFRHFSVYACRGYRMSAASFNKKPSWSAWLAWSSWSSLQRVGMAVMVVMVVVVLAQHQGSALPERQQQHLQKLRQLQQQQGQPDEEDRSNCADISSKDVILLMADKKHHVMLLNALHFMHKAAVESKDFSNPLEAVYLVCLDSFCNQWRRKHGIVGELHAVQNSPIGVVWRTRLKAAQRCLRAGKDVLVNDIDAVWVKDPRVYLDSIPADVDVIAQRGTHPAPVAQQIGATLVCGFILFRSTNHTLALIDDVFRTHSGGFDDQTVINNFIFRQGGRPLPADIHDTFFNTKINRVQRDCSQPTVTLARRGFKAAFLSYSLFDRHFCNKGPSKEVIVRHYQCDRGPIGQAFPACDDSVAWRLLVQGYFDIFDQRVLKAAECEKHHSLTNLMNCIAALPASINDAPAK